MKKRILSLLLLLLLVLSCATPLAFAEEGAGGPVQQAEQRETQQQAESEDETAPQETESPDPSPAPAEDEEYQEQLAEAMNEYYKYIVEVIVENYRFGITKEEIYEAVLKELIGTDEEMMEKAIEAIFTVLDENSSYLPNDVKDSFMEDLNANTSGVGIVITNMDGKIVVTGFTSEDAPAKVAGVKNGDVLVSVDGQDVTGLSATELSANMKGEVGSQVTLGFQREGEPDILYFTLTRAAIKQSFVTRQFLQGDIMYLKLASFNQGCYEDMKKALEDADKRGTKKILLDLRYNSGGYAEEALKIASLFLPKDSVITTLSYKDEKRNEVIKSTAAFKEKKYDIAVLVNGYSASASELLTGALRDNEAGYVIGTRTYGKGTGQALLSIVPFNSMARLTVYQYLTPNGEVIPANGLYPNEVVKNRLEFVNECEHFEPVTFERKLFLGDRGKDVLAYRQRLSLLKYYVGDVTNEEFDQTLFDAVSQFQADSGLYSYGALDTATELAIYTAVNSMKVEIDVQFERGYEYLKAIKK